MFPCRWLKLLKSPFKNKNPPVEKKADLVNENQVYEKIDFFLFTFI